MSMNMKSTAVEMKSLRKVMSKVDNPAFRRLRPQTAMKPHNNVAIKRMIGAIFLKSMAADRHHLNIYDVFVQDKK